MEESEKRILKRVFARIRGLVDLVCETSFDDDDPGDVVGCNIGMSSGARRSNSGSSTDDCAVM